MEPNREPPKEKMGSKENQRRNWGHLLEHKQPLSKKRGLKRKRKDPRKRGQKKKKQGFSSKKTKIWRSERHRKEKKMEGNNRKRKRCGEGKLNRNALRQIGVFLVGGQWGLIFWR